MSSSPEQRRRLKAWYKECDRVDALRKFLAHSEEIAERRALFFIDTGQMPPPLVLPDYPEFPPECEGMTCGAKAKSSGQPCKSKEIHKNGRCKFHGGLSTGPKSTEGKLAALENLRLGREPHRTAEKT